MAAWLKLKPGSNLSGIALAAYAKDHLDEAVLPHYFKIVSDFPMTKSGKVQKFKLAELAVKEYLAEEQGETKEMDPPLKEAVYSDEAPAALGPYSQAIRSGTYLFTSGQVGMDPVTGRLAEGGIQNQARQAMENLKAVLEAAGSDLSRVVKATVYLADINDFSAFNAVYGTYFTSDPPARSAFQVAALPLGAAVEIEMIAIVG